MTCIFFRVSKTCWWIRRVKCKKDRNQGKCLDLEPKFLDKPWCLWLLRCGWLRKREDEKNQRILFGQSYKWANIYKTFTTCWHTIKLITVGYFITVYQAHCTKCFESEISFNPHSDLANALCLSIFYTLDCWGLREESWVFQVTGLSGNVGIGTSISCYCSTGVGYKSRQLTREGYYPHMKGSR